MRRSLGRIDTGEDETPKALDGVGSCSFRISGLKQKDSMHQSTHSEGLLLK